MNSKNIGLILDNPAHNATIARLVNENGHHVVQSTAAENEAYQLVSEVAFAHVPVDVLVLPADNLHLRAAVQSIRLDCALVLAEYELPFGIQTRRESLGLYVYNLVVKFEKNILQKPERLVDFLNDEPSIRL